MIRPEFIARLARSLEPGACADWLDGLRAAIAVRPDATEEQLVREATVIAAEADGWRRAMQTFDAHGEHDDMLESDPAFLPHQ